MADSGNHSVNVDDAVLSGKVFYQGVENVLLLLPGVLICREFATDTRGFTVPLDKITGCFADKSRASEFHISALVPRTLVDTALVQADFHLKCSSSEEVTEWVETLQSVVTDRNIRAIEEQQKISDKQASERDDAIGQLISIFPGIDLDVINTILQANGGNLQRSIDALLGMSDPAFNQAPTSQAHTTTPKEQLDLDEQLAMALQDELFLQQVQGNEALRRHISGDTPEFSLTEKLQEMSEATKKTFSDLYHKFKKATERGGSIELTGEEMTSIPKGSATRDPANDVEPDDDEDDVPLERGSKLFTSRKDGYSRVSADEDNQKLFAGGNSSNRDDDDGL